jgi:hypothetical protein
VKAWVKERRVRREHCTSSSLCSRLFVYILRMACGRGGIVWHVAGRKDVEGQKGYVSAFPPNYPPHSVPPEILPACFTIRPIRVSIETAEARSQAAAARTYKCHIIIRPDNERSWSDGGLSSFLYCASRFTGCSFVRRLYKEVRVSSNDVCDYRDRAEQMDDGNACFKVNDLLESKTYGT